MIEFSGHDIQSNLYSIQTHSTHIFHINAYSYPRAYVSVVQFERTRVSWWFIHWSNTYQSDRVRECKNRKKSIIKIGTIHLLWMMEKTRCMNVQCAIAHTRHTTQQPNVCGFDFCRISNVIEMKCEIKLAERRVRVHRTVGVCWWCFHHTQNSIAILFFLIFVALLLFPKLNIPSVTEIALKLSATDWLWSWLESKWMYLLWNGVRRKYPELAGMHGARGTVCNCNVGIYQLEEWCADMPST